jgi:SAM-dependent methyltransferase
MPVSMDQIRNDFDRIALLHEKHGFENDAYANYILKKVPRQCEKALEIGCGTGAFTRLLSKRARSVVAVDLSPQMIRLARSRSVGYQNIEYVLGDITRLSLPEASYDCIVTIAALHHLPLEATLVKIRNTLRHGGVLILQDLVADKGISDRLVSVAAYPVYMARRGWKTGRLRSPRAIREAYTAHGKGDVYLTLNQVRRICDQYLPGARVVRNLLWRYTVVWNKQLTIF